MSSPLAPAMLEEFPLGNFNGQDFKFVPQRRLGLLRQSCCETDTLLQGQYLKDGQELVSAFNIFKLKFFNLENSSNWYLGIWYNNFYLSGNKKYGDIQDKAVWIANRNNPILGRSGSLTVDSLGRLRILRGASSLLELSSTETTGNTTLKLLDSGNLQLQEMDSDGSMRRILWQSFDYPTDTLLPGMKLGFNVKNGKRWELTSWLGDTLPASGSLVFGMDANITNRLTILWRGNMYWASGLWFKGGFSLDELNGYGFLFSFISTESEHYFMYSGDQKYAGTFFPAIMIDQQGILHIYRLDREHLHVHCSPFNLDSNFDCYRQNPRDCLHAGCIVPVQEEPYGLRYSFRETVSAFSSNGFILNETGGRFSSADCHAICMQNSSCLAYASTNLDGTGCEIWNIDPTDKKSSSQSPRTIYIRVKGVVVNQEHEKAATWLVVVASLFLMIPVTWFIIYLVLRKFKVKVTVIFRGMFYFLWGKVIPQMIGCIRRRLPTLRVGSTIDQEMLLRELGIDRRRRGKRSARKNNNELQIFSFESVALATDYFSDANKLGEGEDRPSMLDVVSMIYGDGNNALSLPKEPAFYDGPRRSSPEMEVEPPELENVSANRVTITVMEASCCSETSKGKNSNLSARVGQSCCEKDTLQQGQYLKDGQELNSPFNIFKLKFFNLKNSSNWWYLGIWYNNLYLHNNNKFYSDTEDRAVWIANRNNPISGRSGSLTVDSLGRLKILRGSESLLELSSTETTGNTTLKLLDSGNLQLQEMDSDGSMRRILWQSFDYPTDTLLPGMKLGFNVKSGKQWELTSWLGDTSPASGSFVFGMDANVTNRLNILWRGNLFWASELWFKGQFLTEKFNKLGFVFSFVSTESEHYFLYSGDDNYSGIFPRIMIDQQGTLQTIILNGVQQHFRCSPVFGDKLEYGCYRTKSINCVRKYYGDVDKNGYCLHSQHKSCWSFGDHFRDTVFPSLGNGFILSETDGRLSSYDCYVKCLQNCSCLAYASPHADVAVIFRGMFYFLWGKVIPQMIGCIRRRLPTLRVGSTIDQDMLLRELGIDRRRRGRRSARNNNNNELQIFSFESVAFATDYFSDANKLGEGGFGPVYKVWSLFKDNRVHEVVDPSLGDSAVENPQVLRCIQVALLCVQQNAEDRPSMLEVVSMIYGDGNNALSLPNEPAFYDGPRRSSPEIDVEPPELENVSANRVTITVMEAR
ncbi:unnamed protein product [Arabidopsis arenosa]|uniref:non-specific serine/threonine protein kinase n=1 Tax=Arabidopsis arenosa TaxID=38785 RepID=A0A8S1ZVC3_ARAAE|nr:unnamed protein product [Arabidopsis arenosa]